MGLSGKTHSQRGQSVEEGGDAELDIELMDKMYRHYDGHLLNTVNQIVNVHL